MWNGARKPERPASSRTFAPAWRWNSSPVSAPRGSRNGRQRSPGGWRRRCGPSRPWSFWVRKACRGWASSASISGPGTVAAPQPRGGPAQRSVRHPGARRLLLRRAIRSRASGHRPATAAAHERAVQRGLAALRPGWARLGLNYFFDEATVDYHRRRHPLRGPAWGRLLPSTDWMRPPASGAQRPQAAGRAGQPVRALGRAPGTASRRPTLPPASPQPKRWPTQLPPPPLPQPVRFDTQAEALRWFWMPYETPASPSGATRRAAA